MTSSGNSQVIAKRIDLACFTSSLGTCNTHLSGSIAFCAACAVGIASFAWARLRLDYLIPLSPIKDAPEKVLERGSLQMKSHCVKCSNPQVNLNKPGGGRHFTCCGREAARVSILGSTIVYLLRTRLAYLSQECARFLHARLMATSTSNGRVHLEMKRISRWTCHA